MNDFLKNVPIMNDCRKVEHTLWLKHTDRYNYINAYNLGYLAKLAYSRVILDEKMPNNLDFQHFIKTAQRTFRDCETPDLNKVKLTQIKNEEGEITSRLIPFITLVEPEKGIKPTGLGTGYVDDKSVSVSALFYTDETNAVIAVRGTQENKDFIIDADALQIKPSYNIKGEVHQGFYQQANKIISTPSFKEQFLLLLKGKNLYITGHSLGGAVATILSAYLVEQGFKPLLYTFGSPRVGNTTFVKYYNNKFTHFRHVNDFDVVPVLPGRVLDGNIDKIIKNAIKAGLKGYSPLIAGTMSIFNWQGDSYTHHGNLCQIIGDGDVKIMLPFSLHEISQLRMADMKEEQFKKKEDRAHSTKLNIRYHSMDTYLSNLEQIIKDLYHFYKVDNRCKRETIENCATHSLHHFIQRNKTKLNNRINILQSQITKIKQEVQDIIRKTGRTIPLPSSTFRPQEKEIQLCRELLKKLEQIEKAKIDQYELYSLYVGHPDVAKQLNRLVGVK